MTLMTEILLLIGVQKKMLWKSDQIIKILFNIIFEIKNLAYIHDIKNII